MPIVFVASFFALLGFGFVPSDLADRNAARELEALGTRTTVTDPEVHVGKFHGRGDDYYETDEVRVRLPGVDSLVQLTGIPESEVPDFRPMPLGWQAPTARTGYRPPLEVTYLVQRNGVVRAMARQDLVRAARSLDPETGLLLGFGLLVVNGVVITAGNNTKVRTAFRVRES